MPITEAPTSPPSPSSRPPEPPPGPGSGRRKGKYYDEMEAHELLHVIDELEDERSRLRRREGIWVSVLAHIVIFALIWLLPRYLPQVHVKSQNDLLKEHEKEMTMLNLPPDVGKTPKAKVPLPKGGAPSAKPPMIDRKTLDQLKEQAKAQPAPPVQQPPQQAPEPPPPVAQQPRPQPTQPLPPNPQSQVDAPRPAPTQPNFNTGSAAGDAVRDAARSAAKSGIQMGGGGQLGAPGRGQNSGLEGGAQVLSDTGNWDPNPYVRRVVYDTKQAWYPIIPEEVRAPLLKRGIVGIRFKINRDGSVQGMTLESRSGDVALDKAAWGGILGASPYPPLPPEFKGPYLELRFGFFYNQDPGAQ